MTNNRDLEIKKYWLTFFIICISVTSFAQTGSITNIQVTQRTDGSGLIDGYFDLSGSEGMYYISLEASFNAGTNYMPISPTFINGDVGPICPGTNKHLIWNGLQSSPNTYSTQTKIKIIAVAIPPGAITDIDGNIYQTVTIGTQTWMKENLKTTKYRNGTNIEYPGSNNTAWQTNTTGAYAWYNNDISWKNTYGALYNWHAINNTNGLCPTGWHIPSNAEWTQLTGYISGGTTTGGNQLKSCRQVSSPLGGGCNTGVHPRWNIYSFSIYGTDNYGFSAFPGGVRYDNGPFDYIGNTGSWWSSTEYVTIRAFYRSMSCDYSYVYAQNYVKGWGLSVRCIRD